MEFRIVEIKGLGLDEDGYTVCPHSLSLRLEGRAPMSTGGPKYTVHAVVPFTPEFGSAKIGDVFKLKRFESPLQSGIKSEKAGTLSNPQRVFPENSGS
jgi:hypothetical protein